MLILLQACSAVVLVLFRYRGHALPNHVNDVYRVYNSVDAAPARIMLPAKHGAFSALGTDAATSGQLADDDVVPLCGSAVADDGQEAAISTTLPTWQLPDDNSGLDAFAETLVRCAGGLFGRCSHHILHSASSARVLAILQKAAPWRLFATLPARTLSIIERATASTQTLCPGDDARLRRLAAHPAGPASRSSALHLGEVVHARAYPAGLL